MSRAARVFAADGPWLFSRRTDLLAFGGSALLAWLLVAVGAAFDLLERDTPELFWLACVVAIDVAHVWSTGFRVYFDRGELRARPLLYFGLPLLAYLIGVGLHALGPLAFWRALAYLAVFHFVRQQAGFLAFYARRGVRSRLDDLLERATLYASMLYPLAHWHAHLPRRFSWFTEGDFVPLGPGPLATALLDGAEVALFALLLAFFVRQLALARAGRAVPGKSVLVLSTFACWYGGIVLFDSDYVFTLTNVLLHGVPYFVLTHRYARARAERSLAQRVSALGFVPFALLCGALALGEETLWDRYVWHERAYLFGAGEALSAQLLVFVTPLLAVPQVTHYLLDGFVWRVRSENPVLRRELEAA